MISNLSVVAPGTAPSPSSEQVQKPASAGFADELARRGSLATVRSVRTPLGGEQAAEALERAWEQVIGEKPSDATKAVLTAQWAHETGRGASMMNFNFGGIKGSSPSGYGTEYKTREGWGKNEVRIVDRFRAYQTAEEGAADYVSLLARKYPGAVEAAKAGDPGQFVRELKQARYFTGSEASYVRSVSSMTEAALTVGFQALGEANVNFDSFPTYLAQAPLNATSGSQEAFSGSVHRGPIDTLSFTGVEAIADEVGRAALKDATRRRSDEQEQG